MDKKWFHKEFEQIEVPSEDVSKAIQSGVRRVEFVKKPRKKVKHVKTMLFSAAAATLVFFSSGFVSPSMSHALAGIPFLGGLYEDFNDSIGENLASRQLVTKLHETAASQGIKVSITSAYYDGASIGITFNVKGNIKANQDGHFNAFYEIFGGDESISDSKEFAETRPTHQGFSGHIQTSYPKAELPADATVPITFKEIGNQEGTWQFNVPITQLPYETIKTNKTSKSVDGDINVHFDSVIAGKSSTAINYTATFPSEEKHDQVRLAVYNDQGKRIQWMSDGDLKTTTENDQVTVKGRTIIPQALKGETSYLEVHPKVAIDQKDQFVSLHDETPVEINAKRQDHDVNVEKIDVKDDKVVFDFQVNHGEKNQWDFSRFKNFAKNDVILVKESEKHVYQKPIMHSLNVLDKENLRFSSTFDISAINGFNSDDYVLRVDFGILSANMPLELEPVKIPLDE